MAVTTTGALIASLVMAAAAAAAKGVSSYMTAKAQSKQLAAEGTERAKARDKRTKMLAASQKASFLSSGISLTGDEESTSGAVIGETYKHGLEDVETIKSSYNSRIKDVMAGGRMALVSGLVLGVSFGAKAAGAMGDLGGADSTDVTAETANNLSGSVNDMDYGAGSNAGGYGLQGAIE